MRITFVASFVAVLCASPALLVAQVPPNDLCTNATTVSSLPFTDGGLDWASATADLEVECTQLSGFQTKYGVWYQYTPATSHDIQVLANTSECSPNVVAIFTGSCGSLTELACARSEPLRYSLTSGTTYRILVGDYYNVIAGPPSGTIGATIRVPPAPPANDQCGDATVVSTVPFADPGVDYSTAGADASRVAFVSDVRRKHGCGAVRGLRMRQPGGARLCEVRRRPVAGGRRHPVLDPGRRQLQ